MDSRKRSQKNSKKKTIEVKMTPVINNQKKKKNKYEWRNQKCQYQHFFVLIKPI